MAEDKLITIAGRDFKVDQAESLIAFGAELAHKAQSPEEKREALRAWLHGAKSAVSQHLRCPPGSDGLVDVLIAALEYLDAGRTTALLQKSTERPASPRDAVAGAKARAVAAVDLLVRQHVKPGKALQLVASLNGMDVASLRRLRSRVSMGSKSAAVRSEYPDQRSKLRDAIAAGTRMAEAMSSEFTLSPMYYFYSILEGDRFLLSAIK